MKKIGIGPGIYIGGWGVGFCPQAPVVGYKDSWNDSASPSNLLLYLFLILSLFPYFEGKYKNRLHHG